MSGYTAIANYRLTVPPSIPQTVVKEALTRSIASRNARIVPASGGNNPVSILFIGTKIPGQSTKASFKARQSLAAWLAAINPMLTEAQCAELEDAPVSILKAHPSSRQER